MAATLVATATYEKRISRLLPPCDRRAMEDAIAWNPDAHPVVPGTAGVRKARWGRLGMGKRGGIRVIYYWLAAPDLVLLITAYAKNAKENLSDADKAYIRRIVADFRRRG